MADEQVNYSDFIEPDGSIEDLIKQLEELKKVYSSTLKEIENDAKKTQDALRGVSSATAEGQEAIETAAKESTRLSRAQKKLSEAYSETGKKAAELELRLKKQNTLNATTAKLNASVKGSYEALSAQYALNKIKLNDMTDYQRRATSSGKKLEQQTSKLYSEMNRLQKATGKHTLEVGKYGSALAGLPGPIGAVTTSIKAMTASALAFIATPFGILLAALAATVAVIRENISVSKEYDAQVDRVTAITKANATETRILSSEAKRLGSTTSKTATEVASLQEEYAKMGFIPKQIMEATEATIGLAEATQSDLAKSASIAAGTVRGFGLDTKETQRVVDVMAASFTKTALDLTKFDVAMSQVGPAAKNANFEIEEVTAMLGILTNANMNASTAGRSVKNMFLETANQGITYAEALNRIRTSTNKNKTALELFGKEGAIAAIILADNVDQTQQLAEQLRNSEGAARSMADVVRDNLKGDTQDLSSAWEGLFLALDDGNGIITKTARSFVNTVTKMLLGIIKLKSVFVSNWNQMIEQSAVFRVSFVLLKAVVDNTIGFTIGLIKTFGSTLYGLGQMIKGVLVGDLDKISQGWDRMNEAVSSANKSIIASGKALNKDIKDAYNNDKSMKRFLIDVENIDASLMRNSETVEDYSSLLDGSIGLTEEEAKAAAKAARDAERARKAKYDALIKELDIIEKLEKSRIALSDGSKKEKDAKNLAAEARYLQGVIDLNVGSMKFLTDLELETLGNIIKFKNKKQLDASEGTIKKQYEYAAKEFDITKKLEDSKIDALSISENDKAAMKLSAENDYLDKIISLNGTAYKQLSDDEIQTLKNRKLEIINLTKDLQKDTLKIQYEGAMLEFDVTANLMDSEIELLKENEKEKTRLRLEAEKERLQKIVDLNRTVFGQLSDDQIAILSNTIAKIDKEISNLGAGFTDIYELVGIDLPDDKKQAIAESVSYAVSQIAAISEAKVKAAQESTAAANGEADAAEDNLRTEIEARNAGFANSVDTARKELETAQRLRLRAMKDQEKAEKQQRAMQSIQQASNLITASAKIWGTLGFPAAIPALGIMWGSFIGAKLKAKSLTKPSTQLYKDGGYEVLKGGSHASGNDIDLGIGPDGINKRAEGGEAFAVINRKSTAKYSGVLPTLFRQINAGKLEDSYMLGPDKSSEMNNISYNHIDISNIEQDLRELKERGNRRILFNGGKSIELYKNLKVVRNGK
jgi:hypothetical protein